jgi:hypothetical protein
VGVATAKQPSRAERRRLQQRDELIAAARALIAEKGVEGAQDAVSDFLVGQLTEETGLFGWGNGAKLKSRNDVDEILRGAFEISKLRDTNPSTPENDGLQSYNNGMGTAYDALEGSGLL